MKKLLNIFGIAILLYLGVIPSQAQTYDPPFVSFTPVLDVTHRNLREVILEDGVYELVVNCDSSTGSSARYVLDVRIQNDTITHIYFDNGGSVHNGWNNSGYSWNGGGIKWSTDYYGDITGGLAVIQVTYQNGRWQLFTISF